MADATNNARPESLFDAMARDEQIRELRRDGLTLRAIQDRLGVAKITVNRALYPVVKEHEKTYNRRRYYVGTCERCGKPCTINKFTKKHVGRWCAACYRLRPEKAHG